jgi:cytochrome c5
MKNTPACKIWNGRDVYETCEMTHYFSFFKMRGTGEKQARKNRYHQLETDIAHAIHHFKPLPPGGNRY